MEIKLSDLDCDALPDRALRNMTVDERVRANKGVDAHCFASGANFMHFLRVAPSAKGEERLHSYRFTVAVAASNFSMRPAKEVSICANEVGDKRVPSPHPAPIASPTFVPR